MIPPNPGRLPQRRTRSAAVSTTGAGRGMRCSWFDAARPLTPSSGRPSPNVMRTSCANCRPRLPCAYVSVRVDLRHVAVRPVPDGRPHISICREAAVDKAMAAVNCYVCTIGVTRGSRISSASVSRHAFLPVRQHAGRDTGAFLPVMRCLNAHSRLSAYARELRRNGAPVGLIPPTVARPMRLRIGVGLSH
jgi:hypothetical protein